MTKYRLEGFSDGVLSIILTIMVLDIKLPESPTFASLEKIYPALGSYLLSFIYIGIYWNNHHHMLHIAQKVTGKILWANLHLLFWLSLVPFATKWLGENKFAWVTMAVYGFTLLMSGIAYWILQHAIIHSQGKNSLLKKAIGKDLKGITSPILYVLGIVFAFYNVKISGGIYIFVALMWLVPDKRIERVVIIADSKQLGDTLEKQKK